VFDTSQQLAGQKLQGTGAADTGHAGGSLAEQAQLRNVMIVDPRDTVAVEQIEYCPGPGIVDDAGYRVVYQPVRGCRDEEAPVGKRRAQAGAEPAVSEREGASERRVERQVLGGPVAHSQGGVGVCGDVLDAGYECVVCGPG
jgi:hypothetical protein